MKVLITGNGKSGSWKIRGDQLGNAIGATISTTPRAVKGFDVVVLVKRHNTGVLPLARAERVPVVYDVVDAWQSTIGNDRGRGAAMRWLSDVIAIVGPKAIVAPTQAMARDLESSGIPTLYLPHHSRPGQTMNPIRERVARVGYEGSERYLGWWRPCLEDECRRRGWEFVVNPPELADVDIVVAVRDEPGYPARHWKSNVKLANAAGSGTPCVLNREEGYLETRCGAERWADDIQDMRIAFDELEPYATRLEAAAKLRAAALPLESVAATYKEWLCALNF